MKRDEAEATVKTTVDLPESLWRSAKMRAIEERSDLRHVIMRALEAYLRPKPRGGK